MTTSKRDIRDQKRDIGASVTSRARIRNFVTMSRGSKRDITVTRDRDIKGVEFGEKAPRDRLSGLEAGAHHGSKAQSVTFRVGRYGREFRYVGVVPMQWSNGHGGFVAEWEGRCSKCGRPFTVTTPVGVLDRGKYSKSFETANCLLHRRSIAREATA